ncbi:MAG TPA: PilC/PilY family type IV pilus protein [Steroidobacteraceae bacterium]|nr:PilC/PilY family type IV pilus protein [Steroidobacteraceae bacterium]
MDTRTVSNYCSTLGAALLMVLSIRAADSAPLALVDAPLFLSIDVKPNLIMAIDDSGSMDFEVSFPTNDGAAWWRYGAADNCLVGADNDSYVGCDSDGATNLPAPGILNFNNTGNSASAANPWRKSVYLFPNGCNGASNSFQKRNCALHHAIPPLPEYGWARSPAFNRAYYDPSIGYKPWVDGGGFTFADSNPIAARMDPIFGAATDTVDLTQEVGSDGQIAALATGAPAAVAAANCNNATLPGVTANFTFTLFRGMTLPAGTCMRPNMGGHNWEFVDTGNCVVGANLACQVVDEGAGLAFGYTLPDNTEVAIRYFPATFYLLPSDPAPVGYIGPTINGLAPDGSALVGYEIKPANFASAAEYTAQMQNFANWFTYYRKRHQALRAGLGQAFDPLTGLRVAGYRINQNPGTAFNMADIDVPADRTNLYNQFYQQWTGAGGTPNRTAVSRMITNFRRTNANAPVQYACQKNFGMLFTDGFSNAPAGGDGITGNFGNVDGGQGAPFADTVADTLADAVMDAYLTPLRAGPGFPLGEVNVPAMCPSADPLVDCNKNLHMNFYAITLNSRGLAYDPDSAAAQSAFLSAPTPAWPLAFPTRHPSAVDDLWHATINGRGLLLNARRPSDISTKLSEVLTDIVSKTGSAASASVNSGSINSETRVFQALFNSDGWSGKLQSSKVGPDGSLLATGAWDTSSNPAAFRAPNAREIITLDAAGTPVAFRATDVGVARLAELDVNPIVAAQKLNYLRGEITNEVPFGTFRNRDGLLLGDIVNSSPAFVGRPSYLYRDTLEAAPYSAFRVANAARPGVVYVGSNDGMLHAFTAETGEELFAYVPGAVFKNLSELTDPAYSHRYYVDGSPTVGDAFVGGAWRSMLVAGLNKGGQGVFALDITNPSAISDSSPAALAKWEFTDADDADLGYTFSRPAIVRMHNGQWAAVFGNGYNNTVADGAASATGHAVLYVVDLETGALIRKIDTLAGSAATPNGLATPAMVDINGDSVVDYAYAGDLLGNMWKFDLQDANPANWDVAYTAGPAKLPIFVARNALAQRQPITVRPEVTRGPQGRGMMVVFGTGKYLEPTDEFLAGAQVQSFYGILDRNTGTVAGDVFPIPGRTVLTQQTITAEGTVSIPLAPPATGSKDYGYRTTSANDILATRGWYIDLISPVAGFQAERQVTDPIIRNGRVIFTTLIPDPNPCAYGGTSWLMEIDGQTGKRLETPPFDLNGDGVFTTADLIGGVVPSGLKTEVGITPKPAVLTSGTGDLEFKFMPGTSGGMQVLGEDAGAGGQGRQSWRQLR